MGSPTTASVHTEGVIGATGRPKMSKMSKCETCDREFGRGYVKCPHCTEDISKHAGAWTAAYQPGPHTGPDKPGFKGKKPTESKTESPKADPPSPHKPATPSQIKAAVKSWTTGRSITRIRRAADKVIGTETAFLGPDEEIKATDTQKARALMDLVNQGSHRGEMHRGLWNLDDDTVKQMTTKGHTFDVGLASFSDRREVAAAFVERRKGNKVVLSVKKGKGARVTGDRFASEDEILSNGRFKVTNISEQGGVHYVEVEQIATYDGGDTGTVAKSSVTLGRRGLSPPPGKFLPKIPYPRATPPRDADPRVHSHPFTPAPSRPAVCATCGMGTGAHGRMVDKPRSDMANTMMDPAALAKGMNQPPDSSYTRVTKESPEHRYTLGPVYVPDSTDAHGDWVDAPSLQTAVWDYVRKTGADRTIYLQHSPRPAGEWVEILTWPYAVEVELQVPGQVTKSVTTFPRNTPFMGVIWEPWAWNAVKDGNLLGFSMGGRAQRTIAHTTAHTTGSLAKHEGPGNHPGTGTPQAAHGRHGGGATSRSEIAPAPWVNPSTSTSTGKPRSPQSQARHDAAFPPYRNLGHVHRTEGVATNTPTLESTGYVEPPLDQPLTDADIKARQDALEVVTADGMYGPDSTLARHDKVDWTETHWRPDRDALHREIVEEFLDGKVNGPFIDTEVLVLGGLPGAGKSTIIKSLAEAGVLDVDPLHDESWVIINPDLVKEVLQARGVYRHVPGLTPAEHSAFLHEESSYVAEQIMRTASARGMNIVIDGTLGSTSVFGKLKTIDELNGHGSIVVKGVFVEVDLDTSVASTLNRHKEGHVEYRAGGNEVGGRFVPPPVTKSMGGSHTSLKVELGVSSVEVPVPIRTESKPRAVFEVAREEGVFNGGAAVYRSAAEYDPATDTVTYSDTPVADRLVYSNLDTTVATAPPRLDFGPRDGDGDGRIGLAEALDDALEARTP